MLTLPEEGMTSTSPTPVVILLGEELWITMVVEGDTVVVEVDTVVLEGDIVCGIQCLVITKAVKF